jgi:signal transduction histidine kinase
MTGGAARPGAAHRPLSHSREDTYRRAVPPPDRGSGPAAEDAAAPVLAAAVRAATSGGQLEATLHEIVRAAVEHVDARYGALGVLRADSRRLDRFVIVGMDADHGDRIGRLPTGQGILGLLVEQPIPLRLDDLGAHPSSCGFPSGHPPMRSFLGVPVRVRDAVFGNLYLTEKRTGGRFTPADAEAAEALASVAGLAIENARLAERAEAASRWGRAATELATDLLSGADPDMVLRTLATRVAALADADLTGILSPSAGHEGSLTIVSAVGAGADDVEGVRVALDEGTHAGATYRAGRPRLVEDISTMPVHGRMHAASIELTRGFGPALLLPLGAPPAMDLLVSLRRSGREPFTADDLELAAAFTAQAAVVLELAHSQQRERGLQRQADRDRIARDLHDHVVQRIFATALSVDRVRRALQPDHPEEAAQLAEGVDSLDSTMAEIRAAIFELHQQEGAPTTSVRSRISEVVRQATEGSGLRRDVRLRGGLDDIPRDLVPDLLAVVRELVTNVVRHAGAGRVGVTVSAGNKVRVVVADDGVGIPEVTARSGLANLADRAERRGGALTTCGGPGGTEVRWVVPWTAPG